MPRLHEVPALSLTAIPSLGAHRRVARGLLHSQATRLDSRREEEGRIPNLPNQEAWPFLDTPVYTSWPELTHTASWLQGQQEGLCFPSGTLPPETKLGPFQEGSRKEEDSRVSTPPQQADEEESQAGQPSRGHTKGVCQCEGGSWFHVPPPSARLKSKCFSPKAETRCPSLGHLTLQMPPARHQADRKDASFTPSPASSREATHINHMNRYAHAHARTHVPGHTYACTHMYMHAVTHTFTICACSHLHGHTVYMHMHAHTQVYIQSTYVHSQVRDMYVCTHVGRMWALVYTHIYTGTCTHMHIHTHTH